MGHAALLSAASLGAPAVGAGERGSGFDLKRAPRGLQRARPAVPPEQGLSLCREAGVAKNRDGHHPAHDLRLRELRLSPVPGPQRPDQLDLQAVSCQQERLGHSPPVSFSAAEVQELRRETGKVRARSATPQTPPLMVGAALRLPCCQPGAGPCSSLANPWPTDQTAQRELRWQVRRPKPTRGRQRAFNVPASVTWRQHREDALPQGPELLSTSPPHGKDKPALVGLGPLSPAMPAHGPHFGGTKPQPNASPPCRHQQPDREARSSFRPMVHQAAGHCSAAPCSSAPWR